jgi:hypothetical protein
MGARAGTRAGARAGTRPGANADGVVVARMEVALERRDPDVRLGEVSARGSRSVGTLGFYGRPLRSGLRRGLLLQTFRIGLRLAAQVRVRARAWA